MASKVSEDIFQCSKCNQFLELTSKTLPCLHSLCRSCLEGHIEGATSDNGKCPQCHEPVTSAPLKLAPFLEKFLRRRHLESSEGWCDWCFEEDGTYSAAKIWCQDCHKFLCNSCNKGHKRLCPGHGTKELLHMTRDEVINVITMDECRLHCKFKDTFCRRCNVCLCDACYKDHVAASPQCLPRSLSVREEASKAKKRGATLEQELRDFELRIRAMNERTKRSINQLSTDCDSKCYKLWYELEVFMEELRLKAGKLCDNMRETKSEQVRKWRLSLEERGDLLEKVKICRLTLPHLLSDDTEDEDVVCGLRSVEAKLPSLCHKSFAPAEKAHLVVTFPDWCHDSLIQLKKEIVDLEVETWPLSNFKFEKEWNLPGSNLEISSILVSDEDGHVFVGDWENKSIKEFRESGESLGDCSLSVGANTLSPQYMCFIHDDIIVVSGEFPAPTKKLFFLQRKQCRPFLEILNTIDTEKEYSSLCQMDDTIFACDWKFDEIDCFSKKGEKINRIKIGGLPGSPTNRPLLCADPTTGNLWLTKVGMSEIFVYNQNGEYFQTVKIEKNSYFCANKYGQFYFSTKTGIFSALPKNILYKFKKNINSPLIVVSTKKLFICHKYNNKYLMKIFKINY